MSKTTIFIQVQGKPAVVDAEVSLPATAGDLQDALKARGIDLDKDHAAFVDEAEAPVPTERSAPIEGLKHGARVHVTRCKRVAVTVHFLAHTIERVFPPGTRVRAVKQWAVRELKISPTDAGEHVLQICNAIDQPPTDTALAELVQGHACSMCFDLVPEKRIEG
jgi:hypothetical protein